MNHKELITNNIKQHLINCKLDVIKATKCANDAYEYYLKQVGNSKDPYKQTCDHAGQLASGMVGKGKFKYKSPVNKTGRRVKKPQDAFDF